MTFTPPNPYQAPAADYEIERVVPGDFRIDRSIEEAFRVTKAHFPLWLGVGVVGMLCIMVAAVTLIGYFLVVPVLVWGMARFLLNMVDGRPDFNDLFSGFSRYGGVLGQTLLLMVIYVGLTVFSESLVFVGQALKQPLIQGIGWLLYMAFFALVMVRLYMALFFLVDRDMSAIEALSASWNATRGKTLKLLGLAVVTTLLTMAGLLALCVGVVFTATVAYVSYASAYRQLAGPPPSARERAFA